ncbi:hypothetical protein EDB89DRAFT_2230596 [Lactarius sanguifluus]|nr:hypothetical protein EDB89DRAFT_2230596 [Lactarius sanguifluus]
MVSLVLRALVWELKAIFEAGPEANSRPWNCKLQRQACSECDHLSSSLFASIPNSHPSNSYQLTKVSTAKAREALVASNDVSAALVWPQNCLAISGVQEAANIAHHAAGEGPVGASVFARRADGNGHVHAALVELNCDTDFFACLVPDVTYTTCGSH